MNTLKSIVANPSGWDSMDNYIGQTDFDNLEVVLTRSRDSDLLTESNWDSALAMLGGESDNVVIHRFGHWACGWWEALCVKPGTEQYITAQNIESSLADYPVLDEDDWSERETAEADKVWLECYNGHERVEYIRHHYGQFDFHSFAEMLAVARGKYFIGYANELLNL